MNVLPAKGTMPSDNKPLPEPLLPQIYVAIGRQKGTMR